MRQRKAALHQTAPYAWTLFVHDAPVARFFCQSGSWALAAHPQHRPMAMRTIADTIAMCRHMPWVDVLRETVVACAERMRPATATILAFPTR